MKPYQTVPIADYGEPLVPLPGDRLHLTQPHPYEKLGAPYGDRSPFWLREGVLARLLAAQAALQGERPGWQLAVFDAYRPIAVQQFMVDYAFADLARSRGLDPDALAAAPEDPQTQELRSQVHQFWAIPSADPAAPPPHSTGAALDAFLIDETGRAIDFGSPIDECSPRSYPDHFDDRPGEAARTFGDRRRLLNRVMAGAGFARHPREWWHFSWGDQLWAWTTGAAIARYGRAADE